MKRPIPHRELPGRTLTRDDVAAFSDPRDSMSKDKRVEQRDLLEEIRRQNGDLNKMPYGDTIRLYSGEKGDGKSALAAWRAAHHYARGGYVFSNSGLGFGQELTVAQMVRFGNILPPQSLLLIEEGHLFASTYGAGSLRVELILNSLSTIRHQGCDVDITSKSEHRLDWTFRSEIKTAIYPENYRPASGVYRYPPKCYVRPWVIGDYPWQDRSPRAIDRYRPKGAKRVVCHPTRPILPSQIHSTWCLYDSWSEPDVAEGAMMGAGQIRKAVEQEGLADEAKRAENSEQDFFDALLHALEDGWDMGKTMIGWELVSRVAQENGWREMVDKEALGFLKRRMAVNGQNRIRPKDLRQFLVSNAVGVPLEAAASV